MMLLSKIFCAALALTVTGICAQADKPVAARADADPSTTKMTHPTILFTAEEIPRLRAALEEDSYRKEIYQDRIKANADDWVTRTISIPPRGGHYHDFVCTDGARLVWPEHLRYNEPVPAGQEYECSACGSRYSGEKLDAAVRNFQHTHLMTAARDLAFVGAMESNSRYYGKAAEILTAYADAYPGRHTSATQGGIMYQSLSEAVIIIYLAQAYDLVAATDALTADDREHITRDLLWESAEGLITCGIGGNWGSWHLSAVGVIGFATGHPRYKEYGVTQFKKQIYEQLGDDGVWPESIHTYHFYPMRGFLHLAEAAWANGENLYEWEAKPGKSLKAMFTQPLQYGYPNMQLPAINDGWYDKWLPLGIYEVGYNRLQLPELGWAVSQLRKKDVSRKTDNPDGTEMWRVIHGISLPDDIPAPEPRSTNFDYIGICTLRYGHHDEREVMLTFDYGRNLPHGQADKMGITLFARGQLLMQDFGTPSYGSSILPYYTGTSSHNTIVVDGKDQQRSRSHGLLAFIDEPELKAAVAETTEVATGLTWSRLVALTPEYALVADYLDSDESHQYDSLLHAAGDNVSLTTATQPASVSTDTLGLRWFNNIVAYPAPMTSGTARWSDNSTNVLDVSFVSRPAVNIFSAQIPGVSGRNTVPALVQRSVGSDATSANLLHVSKEQPPLGLELSGSDITVRGTTFSDHFTSNSRGLRWHRSSTDGLQSDPVVIYNTNSQ